MAKCEHACTRDCTGGCGGCGGNCVNYCADTCNGSCSGGCEGSCKGTCSGGCEKTCKGGCQTLGGINGYVNWEYVSEDDTINIKAEDWNLVVTEIFSRGVGTSSAINSTKVVSEEPISAKKYQRLYDVIAHNANPNIQAQSGFNDLPTQTIANETIITAKHFSSIGYIFNNWPIPIYDAE